jgi:hypothetical protein
MPSEFTAHVRIANYNHSTTVWCQNVSEYYVTKYSECKLYTVITNCGTYRFLSLLRVHLMFMEVYKEGIWYMLSC